MKEEELEIVFRAIEKHADGFWNEEPREGHDAWNGYLFWISWMLCRKRDMT